MSYRPIEEHPFNDPFMDLLFHLGCEFIFNPKPDESKTITGPGGASVDAPGAESAKKITP